MLLQGDTGWMDSLDPVFGTIADAWMRVLIDDFGTDHWYVLIPLFASLLLRDILFTFRYQLDGIPKVNFS